MTHIRVVIDEIVAFDGEPEAWSATPPDFLRDLAKPDALPEPWLKAIMVVMADAALTGVDTSIEAVTGTEEWAIGVKKL